MKLKRRLLFLSGVQILLSTIGFLPDLWPEMQHVNMNLAFSASPDELERYYPNHFRSMFWGALCIKYALPLLFVAGLLVFDRPGYGFFNQWVAAWRKKDLHWSDLYIPSAICFGLLLIGYFLGRPLASSPYQFQWIITQVFLVVCAMNGILLLVLNRVQLGTALQGYLFASQLPYSLAITRILFFLLSANTYLQHYYAQVNHIGSLQKASLPGIGWLIALVPVNPVLYASFCVAGIAFALMIVIGYRTRLFLILNAIVVFYVIASPNFYGKLWHNQLIIWIAWIMAASPCYDVLSIDALRKKQPINANYGFHLKVIWLHFGLIYFFAGFHKLSICGLDWALTNSMISQVQIEWFEHYDKVPDFRIDTWPIFLKAAGLGVIIFELFFPIFLFGNRTKWISIVGGLAMHRILAKVMYIGFEALQHAYLVFIPWNEIVQRLKWIKQKTITHQPANLKSIWVIIPLSILSLNFLFGLFNINSYPFSVYPVYAEIVPSHVKYFDYRIVDTNQQHTGFRAEGKKHNFKWESYSRLEYHIIRMRETAGKLDTAGVKNLWKRWQLQVPTLQNVDSIDVYVVERPVNPDSATHRLSEHYLMSIYK